MKKNNNNRSHKFDYFTKGFDPKEQKKERLKKIWQSIKIFLYVVVFGLTLTGCVQSFVVTTSSHVGNGLELYLDKEAIAPKVNVFDEKTETIKADQQSDEKIDLSTYELNPEKNIYIGNDYENAKNVLNALREQTASQKGEYGKYGSFSSSISLNNIEENQIFNVNNNYLFKAQSTEEYISIYHNQKQVLEDLLNSKLYVFGGDISFKDENKGQLTLPAFKGVSNTIFTQFKFDEATKQYKFNPVIAEVKDSNQESTSQVKELLGGLYELSFADSINFAKEDYANIQNQQDKINKANAIYANDLLVTLIHNSVYKWDVKKYFNNLSVSEFIKQNIYDVLKADINAEVTLTQAQYNIIEKYLNTINSYASVTGFVTPSVFLQYQQKEINAKFANNNDELIKGLNQLKDQYSGDVSKNRILKFEFLDSQNSPFGLPLKGDSPQKAITSWGESWELGPFYGLLVYPLNILIQSTRQAMPNLDGWASIISIIIAVIVTKAISLALSFKGTMSQSIQEDLKTKKAVIEAKYKGFENNKQMKIKKQQEISNLYKKHNIKPIDQFASVVLAMPIFFAMWRVIQGVPEIKSTVWLTINFASVSWRRLFAGEWPYFFVLFFAAGLQFVSQFLPKLLNKKRMKQRTTIAESEALKKSEKTQNIMMIVFLFITLIFSAGVQIYWIFGSIWVIGQTLALHKLKKTDWFKYKYSKKFETDN
ncbi:membrane protein insertase YidC [Mycoplasmopsis ciconiae]|uniref:Membrane protein insertase YidC n=1 Tax=Mycoplasmopsis ciconiae TaxID=561067 RepID=A0ABU7ML79_9BACT|nr:membrane protein insertase YidC [Mycoplasmopsis ciconiae]